MKSFKQWLIEEKESPDHKYHHLLLDYGYEHTGSNSKHQESDSWYDEKHKVTRNYPAATHTFHKYKHPDGHEVTVNTSKRDQGGSGGTSWTITPEGSSRSSAYYNDPKSNPEYGRKYVGIRKSGTEFSNVFDSEDKYLPYNLKQLHGGEPSPSRKEPENPKYDPYSTKTVDKTPLSAPKRPAIRPPLRTKE